MLKKLYKHEFRFLYRSLLPIYGALCLLALLSRICFGLLSSGDEEFLLFTLVKGAMAAIYIAGIFALSVLTTVIIVIRFYKNCFSGQGYLTFSLPFSAGDHLNCKLICGGIAVITTYCAVAVSLLIVLSGTQLGTELLQDWVAFIRTVWASFPLGQVAFLLIFGLLILLAAPFVNLLEFYFCIAVGQKYKNKIVAAIIVYFILYAAGRVASALLAFALSLAMENIADLWPSFAIAAGAEICILTGQVILGAVFYFATRRDMTYHLNLQ